MALPTNKDNNEGLPTRPVNSRSKKADEGFDETFESLLAEDVELGDSFDDNKDFASPIPPENRQVEDADYDDKYFDEYFDKRKQELEELRAKQRRTRIVDEGDFEEERRERERFKREKEEYERREAELAAREKALAEAAALKEEEIVLDDEDLDDALEGLTEDDLIDYSDVEDEVVEPEENKKRGFGRKRKEEEPQEESTFIDKEKKKLRPFGGSKTNKKAKTSEFDARKNRRQKALAIQIGVLLLLVSIVGLGVYNVFSPPQGITEDEFYEGLSLVIGDDDFPLEKGGVYAENFMEAFLTVDSNNSRDPILNYYYTGVISDTNAGNIKTRNVQPTDSRVRQTVLSTPKVVESYVASDKSAYYKVATLVQVRVDGETNEDEATVSQKWVFYNVNVYYDATTDVMAITDDSPMLLPPEDIAPSTRVEDERLPGQGGQASAEVKNSVRPTLHNFFETLAGTSFDSFENLTNFLSKGSFESVNEHAASIGGFNGEYELRGGDPNRAIEYTVYNTDDPNKIAADVKVSWVDSASGNSIVYNSRYYVAFESTGDTYLISEFSPRVYRPESSG